MNCLLELNLFTHIVFCDLDVKLNISFFSAREERYLQRHPTIKLGFVKMRGDIKISYTCEGCPPIYKNNVGPTGPLPGHDSKRY